MRELYSNKSANYPRLTQDKFFTDYDNSYGYYGFINDTFRFVEDFQLLKPKLWQRFVNQFRHDADGGDAGWRGEYWGKMMRSACFVYSYTKNDDLYKILLNTVEDMISSADNTGRISSYAIEKEFDGWDIWCRKYVLLGMQYFLEICKDTVFTEKIIASMKSQANYIIDKIGNQEGKKPITSATRHWRGLNSSSLLEPIVRLYSLTGDKKYLDFAKYIVDCGGTDVVNIFELAYKNEFYPYQYPVTKAYEMTSCFEGLLEYYRITGEDWYRIAILNFADKILESDFTVIGCCGCTHELFDHSTVRQANTNNGEIMQETCVTVTLMKFFYQLNLLTGNSKYADAFEISLYNAYLGAINTEQVIEPTLAKEHPDWNIEPLPFDSYSPLTAGTRGNGIGGLKLMNDNHYYGCCACIGSAGIGLVPKLQLLTTENGFVMNLFINGTVETKTPCGNKIIFETETEYPKSREIKIEINSEQPEEFELLIRNPYWSGETEIYVNDEKIDVSEGYTYINRIWKSGDKVKLLLDMRTKAIYPIPYGEQILMNKVIWGHNYMVSTYDKEDPIAHKHVALRRGPIMLAQENRLGYSVDKPISIKVNADGTVDAILPMNDIAPYKHIVEVNIPLADGGYMTVTDYASAGKLWTEESKMAVWMLTE
ncbi:MAG: beta-L-arabinofuranosidase domain-containing protein [Clostridia bacterium]